MTMRYVNQPTGIEINVTKPAEKLLGPHKMITLVKDLTEVMRTLGATVGYVCKRGESLEITVLGPEGWTGTMKVER